MFHIDSLIRQLPKLFRHFSSLASFYQILTISSINSILQFGNNYYNFISLFYIHSWLFFHRILLADIHRPHGAHYFLNILCTRDEIGSGRIPCLSNSSICFRNGGLVRSVASSISINACKNISNSFSS